MFEDVKALRELVDVDACTIIAVNDAGFRWPARIDHWATLHPEELAWRRARREGYGYPGGFETWTRPYPHGMQDRERLCDHVLGGWDEGSSGWMGVGVAWATGHRKIIGCGVPMDGQPHLDRPRGWQGFGSYRHAWAKGHAKMAPYLRSMSGWTRELYGAPDARWLDSLAA